MLLTDHTATSSTMQSRCVYLQGLLSLPSEDSGKPGLAQDPALPPLRIWLPRSSRTTDLSEPCSHGFLKLQYPVHSSADHGICLSFDNLIFQIFLHNLCLKPIKTKSSVKKPGRMEAAVTPTSRNCLAAPQARRQYPLGPCFLRGTALCPSASPQNGATALSAGWSSV